MKKYLLGFAAIMVALGLTAFAAVQEKSPGTYWWFDGEEFQPYNGEVCEDPGMVECKKPHPDPMQSGTVTIYKSQSLDDPLLYDGN